MTNPTLTLDREAWLTEAAELIQAELITPKLPADHIIPHNFRVSVGFPPNSRASSSRIAVCFKAEASKDNTNEIFITPTIDDSITILAALSHELIHQADNCESGHRNFFAKVARRIGLEGKLTATTAGDEITDYLNTLIDVLGPIPHAKLDVGIAKPKQQTRMIKVYCPACAFQFRTTNRHLICIQLTQCIACLDADMIVED